VAISHLEDLPLAEFIKAVENIGLMKASEKLDGANLWMGLDDDGKLFTNRSGKRKGSKNFYSADEYPHFSAYNGFRGAHAALMEKLPDIKRIMQNGQIVELEILYGRQPNAITYGAGDKSYIAFLRGVEGTPDVIADQLSMSLGGQTVSVSVDIVDTSDGENLSLDKGSISFQFTGAQNIPAEKLKDVNLSKHLNELKKYLEMPAGVDGVEATNYDILTKNLTSFTVDVRPQVKAARSIILASVMKDFKLPIKRELLDNYVNKIKPALGADNVDKDEDLGIEGVVLRDPTTGNMIKLVDKDTFTTINQFNHSIRNQISGVVKSLDQDAPLEARGGILGNMKIQIADLLGNRELSRGATAKKAFLAVRGADAVETAKNFAANLDIQDFLGTKRKILALIGAANKQMKDLLADFKSNKDEYQLKLKNGKIIGISKEIEKRTLLAFAESLRNVNELFEKVKKSKSITQVVAILYGHLIKDAQNSEKLDESLLLEKRYDTDKARYSGKDGWTLLNIYFATVFMSVIMFQADDERGIKLLRDKAHYRMSGWSKEMSPLNFWGYPIWKSSTPAVKKLIGPKATGQLFKITRRVPPNQSRFLHMDLSFGKDVPMNWGDHYKTLRVLQQFDGMNTDRINTLMKSVFTFETQDHDGQVKTISKLFYYAQQFIPTSPLFSRIKIIQQNLLINANGENEHLEEMKLLTSVNSLIENEEAQATKQVDTAVKAADVNPAPGISAEKKVEKRKRNPNIVKNKFPRPKNAEDQK
jgi:hypothetical protein